MERTGLVARIEEDLERVISLGKLPRNGFLPSEQVLARRHGVSRATAREALLRLAVRGLVVQHPGRRSRAVPLQESVTLENLSVALHAEGPAHPERRRLLEGFFELKREMTVELLAACCEHASHADLNSLLDVCFLLEQKTPWEEKIIRAKREFELLRLAALAANRLGHFLLIQSLERSFWAMAERVLPHLDCEAVSRWALCAFHALGERNAQALRHELPALLRAADERLLGVPTSSDAFRPGQSACQTGPREEPPTAASPSEAPPNQQLEADGAHRSACPSGAPPAPPAEAPSSRSSPTKQAETDWTHRSTCSTGSYQALPMGEPSSRASQDERPEAGRAQRSACHTGLNRTLPAEARSLRASQDDLPEADGVHRSTCQAGSCQAPPAEAPLMNAPPRPQPDAMKLTRSACLTGSGSPWEQRVPVWSPVPWGLHLRVPLLPPGTWAAGSPRYHHRGRSAWAEREMTWCQE